MGSLGYGAIYISNWVEDATNDMLSSNPGYYTVWL